MEKGIKISNRKKKRQRNVDKIRSKFNFAIVNNISSLNQNISNKQNKHLSSEYASTSLRNNAVQSKAALRFPSVAQSENNIFKYNVNEHERKQANKENNHKLNKIVWKIPFSNGKGNPDTFITILPSEYSNKSELHKILMKIIASYIDESVPDDIKDHVPMNVNKNQIIFTHYECLKEKDGTKESLMDDAYILPTFLNTKCQKSPTMNTEVSTCSEDESPHHIYYPHRLNQ